MLNIVKKTATFLPQEDEKNFPVLLNILFLVMASNRLRSKSTNVKRDKFRWKTNQITIIPKQLTFLDMLSANFRCLYWLIVKTIMDTYDIFNVLSFSRKFQDVFKGELTKITG